MDWLENGWGLSLIVFLPVIVRIPHVDDLFRSRLFIVGDFALVAAQAGRLSASGTPVHSGSANRGRGDAGRR